MTKGLIILFSGILMSFSLESSSAEETALQGNWISQRYPFKAQQSIGHPDPENLALNIFGGRNANQNEFPHMARLGVRIRIKYALLIVCGGSLISPRFVLSAAQCPSPTWARLGDNPDSYIFEMVVQTFRHPWFTNKTYGDDVALFKLAKDVPLSLKIRPICLHTEPTIRSSHVVASGWGQIVSDGTASRSLKKVFLKLVNTSTCDAFYHTIDGARMLCAGGEIGQSTCEGDTGGPIQIHETNPNCMYSIVGITSFGNGCGSNSPGVYTRVSNYVPWIRSITGG